MKIMDVTKDGYFAAAELGQELKLEHHDALAIDIMRRNETTEIYPLDEPFNSVDGVKLPPQ